MTPLQTPSHGPKAGFDLSPLVALSKQTVFARPKHDWDMKGTGGEALANPRCVLDMNLYSIGREDLELMEADVRWDISKDSLCHGIGSWFDVGFAELPVGGGRTRGRGCEGGEIET